MQSLVLEKIILFPKKVDELIQVTIDDSIEYVNKSDGIILKGKIYLTGEVSLEGEIREFLDTLDVDIYASLDQLIDKKQVQLRVEDFDYSVKENKIFFYIKTIIEGVNDVKSTFPVKEPDPVQEKAFGTVETVVDKKTVEKEIEIISNREDINLEKVYEFVYKEFDEMKEPDIVLDSTIDEECEVKEEVNKDVNEEVQKSDEAVKQGDTFNTIIDTNELDNKKKEELIQLLKDAIIIDTDKDYVIEDNQSFNEIMSQCEVKEDIKCEPELKPIKIIKEKPIKVETGNDTFSYFNLFRNSRNVSSVFWTYRVVLKDDTYESLASEYNISVSKLKSLNNDKNIEIGMLIKIPK